MAERVRARRLSDEEGRQLQQITRRGKHGSIRVGRALIIMASASGTPGAGHRATGPLYAFDEPSTGPHPLDVATLVGVFDRLLQAGATIIVIDHDLDLLAAADHLIDMVPGGGPDGGHIVAAGTPEQVARAPHGVTGPWLADHLGLSTHV
jgi:ABC-type transporter Mla maintaining outer membrane lipid asymmetry ATPase subunit MlaF